MRLKRSSQRNRCSNVGLPDGCCALCRLGDNDPDQFGEKVTLEQHNLTVHYFCLLTSSGVYQRGEENEGIFGFLVKDIKQEINRSSRLTCNVCKKKGAAVGCFVKSCRKMVHYPCGKKQEFIFQFTDLFQSYCRDHGPTQSVPVSSDLSLPQSCSVCLDSIEPVLSYSVLKCPSCHASWFHRDCVQHQAHSAGLFFFRCTLCNNKDSFQAEMLRMGIHIPERDASWELEENAFEELLEVYQQCDAVDCICNNGRAHSAKAGWFEVLRCRLCGSKGTHRKCSGLKVDTPNWACEDCTEAVDGKASLVPRPSPQSGGQRRSLVSKRRLPSIHSSVSFKRPSLSGGVSPEELLQALALQLLSPQRRPRPPADPQPCPLAQSPPQPQASSPKPEAQTGSPQLPHTQPPPPMSGPQVSPQSQTSPEAPHVQLLSPRSPARPQSSTRPQKLCSRRQPPQPSPGLHQSLISSFYHRRSSEPEPPQPEPQISPGPLIRPDFPAQTQTPSPQPRSKPQSSPHVELGSPSSLVVVTRGQALDAGLALVKRSSFNPTHRLWVRFTDDQKLPFSSCPRDKAAKHYFLKLLVQQIQGAAIFEGPPGAKNLALDSQALREDLYFEVGCLLAFSLVHGGPPLSFFSPGLYQCLFNFPRDTALAATHVTHPLSARRINTIWEASSLKELREAMEECRDFLEVAGCNRPISRLEDKQALVDDLVSFTMITRMQLPLQRLREGLRTLGVFEQVQMFPAEFYRLFCGPTDRLSAEKLSRLFSVLFSEQTDRQHRETPVVTFWRHFLLECELGRSCVSLHDILLFATGADAVPALGFQPPPTLSFLHPPGTAGDTGGGTGPGGPKDRRGNRQGAPRPGTRRRRREATPEEEEDEEDDDPVEGEERDSGHRTKHRGRDEGMEVGEKDGCVEPVVLPQSRNSSNHLLLPVVSSYQAFRSSMEQAIGPRTTPR